MPFPTSFKPDGSSPLTLGEQGLLGRPWLQWALGLSAALLAAPLAFHLVQGVAGLVVGAAVGIVGIRAAPVLALKLSYWQLGSMRRTVQGNCLSAVEKQEVDDRAQHEQFIAQSVAEEGALVAAIQGAQADIAANPEQAAAFEHLADTLELQRSDCVHERWDAIEARRREQHVYTINRAKAKAVELGQARDAHRQRRTANGADRRWLRATATDAIEQGMQTMAARRRMTLDIEAARSAMTPAPARTNRAGGAT